MTNTSPINIDSSLAQPCDTRCNYNYNYPLKVTCTSKLTTIDSTSKYISLSYTSPNNLSEGRFNNSGYNVSEIRIYYKSIHKYNGALGVAECIIVHTNGTSQLMVSIPIVMNDITNGSGSTYLTNIINLLSDAPALSQVSVPDFSLNKFIGNTKFYTYSSSSSFDTIQLPTTYIVYHPTDYSIQLSRNTISQIRTLCGEHHYQIYSGTAQPVVSVNTKGPNNISGNEIFIDCKPIDKSKNDVLITTTKYSFGSSSYNNFKQNAILQFLLFFIVCVVFMYVTYFTFLFVGTIIKPSGNT